MEEPWALYPKKKTEFCEIILHITEKVPTPVWQEAKDGLCFSEIISNTSVDREAIHNAGFALLW